MRTDDGFDCSGYDSYKSLNLFKPGLSRSVSTCVYGVSQLTSLDGATTATHTHTTAAPALYCPRGAQSDEALNQGQSHDRLWACLGSEGLHQPAVVKRTCDLGHAVWSYGHYHDLYSPSSRFG